MVRKIIAVAALCACSAHVSGDKVSDTRASEWWRARRQTLTLRGTPTRLDMLKRLALAALLLCVGSAHADGTLHASTFTVDYTITDQGTGVNTASVVNDDAVLWPVGALAYGIWMGPTVPAAFDGSFVFSANPGYAISGYDISYVVGFATDVIKVGFEAYGHPADTVVLAGSGEFNASTGASVSFVGPSAAEVQSSAGAWSQSVTLVDHVDGAAFPTTFAGALVADSFDATCYGWMLGQPECAIDTGLNASVRLASITITPQLVAAIPEPETWVLMVGGLTLFGLRRRQLLGSSS